MASTFHALGEYTIPASEGAELFDNVASLGSDRFPSTLTFHIKPSVDLLLDHSDNDSRPPYPIAAGETFVITFYADANTDAFTLTTVSGDEGTFNYIVFVD